MSRRGVLLTIAALVGVLAAAALGLWAREQAAGSGPRPSDAAPDGPVREIALISNVVDGTVTLVDLGARAVVGALDIKPDGARVGPFRDPAQWLAQPTIEASGGLNYAQDTDLSRDGEVLFVSRGHLGDVAAFEIATGDLLWRTPIAGIRADHMARSPDGTRLYVAALVYGGDVVEVLDTATGERVGAFGTGRWPHDVHVSADGDRIWVASLGDMQVPVAERGDEARAYEVTVVERDGLAEQARHAFDAGIRPFAITEDESTLYAQLSNAHAVIARDLGTGQTRRLDLPVADGVTEADWDFEAPHHGLALTPDETRLCLAGRASDYAAIVATDGVASDGVATDGVATDGVAGDGLELLATVPVGDAPSWAALDAAGELCVLANTRSDDVSLVSMRALEEVARLPAGRAPKHVTIGPVPAAVLEPVTGL
jgi:DNA-binding beta-propeller fold protein YncE